MWGIIEGFLEAVWYIANSDIIWRYRVSGGASQDMGLGYRTEGTAIFSRLLFHRAFDF
jgi:hypothetical protein